MFILHGGGITNSKPADSGPRFDGVASPALLSGKGDFHGLGTRGFQRAMPKSDSPPASVTFGAAASLRKGGGSSSQGEDKSVVSARLSEAEASFSDSSGGHIDASGQKDLVSLGVRAAQIGRAHV